MKKLSIIASLFLFCMMANAQVTNQITSSKNVPDPKKEIIFNKDGISDKNVLLTSRDGFKYYSCTDNVSEVFQDYIYQIILQTARSANIKTPPKAICTIFGIYIKNNLSFNIQFFSSMESLRSCANDKKCEPNLAQNNFIDNAKVTVFATDLSIRKQAIACLNLSTGQLKDGLCL